MSEEDRRRSRHSRNRSRSSSRENDLRSHRQRRYGSDERNDRYNDRSKRHRSRSRDQPRKRRSLSQQSDHGHRKEREEESSHNRRGRHDEYRSHKSKRRRYSSGSERNTRDLELYKRSSKPLPSQQDVFRNEDKSLISNNPIEKQKPNFGNTGHLAAASNVVEAGGGKSISLKYHEPAEARKPPLKDAWRMYIFKDDEILDTLQLSNQSCWLFGREAAIVDLLIEHPSCSKQHAVIQFRYIEKRNEFGDKLGRVKPYIIDLESSNGTFVNEERLPESRYVELRDKDVVKFGTSTREYVVQLPLAR